MTQYTRPQSNIPVWAEAGQKVQPTNPEIQTGWPLSTVPPSRQRFNWILGLVAQSARYLLQRGIAEWSADEDYPQNGRVQYLGVTYRALISSPTSFPGDVPGEWEAWGLTLSELNAAITTPPQFDDDTSIATTAFVRRFGMSARDRLAINAATNPALTVAQVGAAVVVTGTGNVTLPAAAAVQAGGSIILHNVDAAAAFTLQRAGADGILAGAVSLNSISVRSGCNAILISNGANLWTLIGGSASLDYGVGAPLLGVNQNYTTVTGSRAFNTTYTNTTERPILVSAWGSQPGGASVFLTGVVDGGNAVVSSQIANNAGFLVGIWFVVQPGKTYRINTSNPLTLSTWNELR